MKTTLNTSEAASLLMADENADWTRAGAYALIEHLEQIEEDCNTEFEFDRVALRCDYSEYTDLIDWACSYYGSDQWRDCLGISGEGDDEEEEEAISIYIHDHGQLIEFDGGIIVSAF
jgi:hypothetical protein|tara:strand:- start:31 stop:381 length:351 start_codon:yes stop_codon:yes gene_type:complete